MREDGFRETAVTPPPHKKKKKEINSFFGTEKQHQICVCRCGFGPGCVFKADEKQTVPKYEIMTFKQRVTSVYRNQRITADLYHAGAGVNGEGDSVF